MKQNSNKNINIKESNQKIQDYDRKISEFQLKKFNHKNPEKRTKNFFNIRMYFSSFFDSFGRIIILFSQIFFAAGLVSNGFIVSRIIIHLIPNYGEVIISQILMKLFFYILCVLVLPMVLLYILPVMLCSRVGSVRMWCIIFLTVGEFFLFILVSFSIGEYFIGHSLDQKHDSIISIAYYLLPFGCFIVTMILLFIGSTTLLSESSRKIKKFERIIVENYYLNRIKMD